MSVQEKERGLWWEGFVKEVGFELGLGVRVMDDESGKFMERAELVCVERSESKMERLLSLSCSIATMSSAKPEIHNVSQCATVGGRRATCIKIW